MKPVAIVSYPRAGYHLMDAVLTSYFNYITARNNIGCCRTGCCESPQGENPLKLHRSHDFNNLTNPDHYSKIIVIYRKDIVEQIDAYIRYARLESQKCKKETPLSLEGHTTFDSIDEPYNPDQVRWMYSFYNTFVNKWVKTPPINSIVIDYTDLLINPIDTLSAIQTFLTGSHDAALSERITRELHIERKHAMNEEQYAALKTIIDSF